MPATNAWLRRRFFSSPGCRRIRSRQTSSVSAGSSASGPMSPSPEARDRPRPRPRAADRPCPSASGRGSGPRRGAVAAGSQAAPGRPGRRVGRRPPSRGAEAEHDRRLRRLLRRRRGELEPAGEHRVDDDAVSIELEESRNLPSRRTRRRAGRRARQLGRRAAHGKRRGRLRDVTTGRSGRRGARRRRPPDRAVRARARDCSRAIGAC